MVHLESIHFYSYFVGSWRGSLFVMMCVLCTCVDVAGFMHWWGITIEITSMNIVIIRYSAVFYNYCKCYII